MITAVVLLVLGVLAFLLAAVMLATVAGIQLAVRRPPARGQDCGIDLVRRP